MRTLWIILTAMMAATAISCGNRSGWSSAEMELIRDERATMRVLTVNDAADSLTLRKECRRIGEKGLKTMSINALPKRW